MIYLYLLLIAVVVFGVGIACGNLLSIHSNSMRQRERDELHHLQLVAICVASNQNTRRTAKDRLPCTDRLYTAAYHDVCKAVDREMALRERVMSLVNNLRE